MSRPNLKRNHANRQNAQLSTGPKTIEGKNRSRWNALTHGLLAQSVVLPDCEELESPEQFRELLSDLCDEYRPVGMREGMAGGRELSGAQGPPTYEDPEGGVQRISTSKFAFKLSGFSLQNARNADLRRLNHPESGVQSRSEPLRTPTPILITNWGSMEYGITTYCGVS